MKKVNNKGPDQTDECADEQADLHLCLCMQVTTKSSFLLSLGPNYGTHCIGKQHCLRRDCAYDYLLLENTFLTLNALMDSSSCLLQSRCIY